MLRINSYLNMFLEVGLVAFFVVLVSWYWSVDEHVVYLVVFAGAGLLALRSQGRLRGDIGSFLPAGLNVCFLAWIMASTLWSGVFHLSLSYAVLAFLVGGTGTLLAYALPMRSTLLGISAGVGFIVLHGALADGREFPNLINGPILGLFTNVSSLSVLLGVGLLTVAFLPSKSIVARTLTLIAALLFLAQVVAQDVLTGVVASVAALAVGAMVLHVRWSSAGMRTILSWVYPSLVLLSATLFWFFREPILRPLGEGPDLSGRVILWDWYFEAFLWRPVIGGGWGNTVGWPPLEPDRLEPVKEFFPAHNGFIDIGLFLGGVGALLMIATLVALFIAGAKLAIDKKYSTAYLFIPALVTYLTLNDLMATSLPRFIGLFLVGAMVGMVLKKPEMSPLSQESANKTPRSEGSLEPAAA